MNEEPEYFGDEEADTKTTSEALKQSLGITKNDVNPYDIFRLAKGVLLVATGIFLLLALLRIFYTGNVEGVKEVWDFSKVVLNSIVSLVLGLYYGSRQDLKKL